MSAKILFLLKEQPKVEPLGILYLSAALQAEGHGVGVGYGMDHEGLIGAPDYVAYSVMTGDRDYFLTLNRELKSRYEFISVFGGPDPTFFPEAYRDNQDVDVFVRGEGEEAFPAIIRENLDGEIIGYPVNIDDLPHPDRALFPTKIHHFIASRGCPFSCTYCFNSKWKKLFEDKRVRYRNMDDLMMEINDAKPSFVYFQDDCFGASRKWLKRFVREYPKIPYHCHLRADTLDDEYIALLHESNCVSAHVALETANEEYRKKILGRRMSNQTVVEACKKLQDAGIRIMLQNMIGLPGTTIQDDMETLDLNKRIKPEYAWCSIYQPYPGTVLGDDCIKKGLVVGHYHPSFFESSPLNFDDDHISKLEVLQKEFAVAVKHNETPAPLTRQAALKRMYDRERYAADKILYKGII